MPRAKLSQIATTWVDEEDSSKKKGANQEKSREETRKQLKKKQTFSLKLDTIKRLWVHRIRTDKPLSEIMDDLVLNHLPAVNLENLSEREKNTQVFVVKGVLNKS